VSYSSTLPPFNLAPRVGGGPGNLWGYNSSDSVATVAGSSYFSNGAALGLKVGDRMHVVQLSTAGAFTAHGFGVVSAVTAGAGASVTFAATST
jgi:hypothetical protein